MLAAIQYRVAGFGGNRPPVVVPPPLAIHTPRVIEGIGTNNSDGVLPGAGAPDGGVVGASTVGNMSGNSVGDGNADVGMSIVPTSRAGGLGGNIGSKGGAADSNIADIFGAGNITNFPGLKGESAVGKGGKVGKSSAASDWAQGLLNA